MHKYRLCFSKDGLMIYIGHLDLLKLFQRALKRSGLPVAYSQGFNPHQLVSFALPLPIGYSGANEYSDITFEREPEPTLAAFAKQLPQGLTVNSARELLPNERPAAALVDAALYEIELSSQVEPETLNALLSAKELIVAKKTKSGETMADIRPDIISLRADGRLVTAMLSAGSTRGLKPELLIRHINGSEPLAVRRLDLYHHTKNGYIPLSR